MRWEVPEWDDARKALDLKLRGSCKYVSELQGMGVTVTVLDDPELKHGLGKNGKIINFLQESNCILS
jgi:hypothetical protein